MIVFLIVWGVGGVANINNDTEKKASVRREAKSIMKKLLKFGTAFM